MTIEEIKQYIKNEGLELKSQKREYVYRRAYLYKYLKTEFGFSLHTIGKMFNRDHATVISGLSIYDRFKDDSYFIGFIMKELDRFFIQSSPINLPNKNMVMVKFNKEMYLKVQLYRINKGLATNEEAIKDIVETL